MHGGVACRGPLPTRAGSAGLAVGHVNDTSGLSGESCARLATAIRDLWTAGRCDLLLHGGDVNLAVPADLGETEPVVAAIRERMASDPDG
ncbi:MAG TPA: hypothetical protein VG370_21570 [Chloroflexota bacterium]|jgi:hypothetical protein|nr:hypothetical protein [Chloroflexota bacterium]